MTSSQIREYTIEEIRQEMEKLRESRSLVRLVGMTAMTYGTPRSVAQTAPVTRQP